MESGRDPGAVRGGAPGRDPRPAEEELVEAHRAGYKAGAARSLAQTFCLAGGLTLIAVGILGFIFGGSNFDTGAEVDGQNFIVFEVNGWHNIVHIASGAFLLLMGAKPASAAIGALAFGVVYAAVAIWGFVDGKDLAKAVVIDNADNWLHTGLAALGILVGLTSGALGAAGRRERQELGVP